jgi:hypothetical protein
VLRRALATAASTEAGLICFTFGAAAGTCCAISGNWELNISPPSAIANPNSKHETVVINHFMLFLLMI